MAQPPDKIDDGWTALRGLTPARIGLARTGVSIATAPLLDFRRAHAAARDAVNRGLDAASLCDRLAGLGNPVLSVRSRVATRRDYLMRPDLGRLLDAASAHRLAAQAGDFDLVIIVADGLSAQAADHHAAPLLAPLLATLGSAWRIAPLVVAEQARVALGDAVCTCLGAAGALILIGERPGLSAPISLGAYLTWRPSGRTTDADRNCISNIRPDGLDYGEAARRIAYLLAAARRRNLSGVALKDFSTADPFIASP
jgi:ethanolamine ammonia-lyase small subunit